MDTEVHCSEQITIIKHFASVNKVFNDYSMITNFTNICCGYDFDLKRILFLIWNITFNWRCLYMYAPKGSELYIYCHNSVYFYENMLSIYRKRPTIHIGLAIITNLRVFISLLFRIGHTDLDCACYWHKKNKINTIQLIFLVSRFF